MTAPAATVVLPVYNAARYVGAAITSILEQTYADFELLLLDDGSSDNSAAILGKFAARDSRCIVQTRKNRGVVFTLNEGIALSRAEILIRMDADDISHPGRFEAQMAYLDAHPLCVAVGSEVMLIDPEGQPLRPWGVPCDHAAIEDSLTRGQGGMIVHPAVAMRKSAVLRIGGYREEFKHAEDFDLFLRLAEIGHLANLPEVQLDYRQHPTSIGYRHTAAQFSAVTRALTAARARRGLSAQDRVMDLEPDLKMTADGVHRKWAWWALSAGNVTTARKHAFKAARLAPFATENLRLLTCVIRGY